MSDGLSKFEEKIRSFDIVYCKLDLTKKLMSKRRIKTPEDAVAICGELVASLDREVLMQINMDAAGHPINCSIFSIGLANCTVVGMREVMKNAILSNARQIIILHNHPSGNLTPSREDVALVQNMYAAAKLIDIQLQDHIIVGTGTDDFLSMERDGYFTFDEQIKLRTNNVKI